jgi:hypothetical protein
VRPLVSPGESADHLGAAFDLAERPFERVRASPPAAVAGWVAQVDDARVEIVAKAAGRGGVAGRVELADQGQEPLLSVALAGGLVERLPVRLADAFALAFGDLGQEVAHAVHGAVLAVRCRPAVLDGLDQPGGAVVDDQHRRAESAADEARPSSASPRGTRASPASPPRARARRPR